MSNPWFEFKSRKFRWFLSQLSVRVENRICLSHGVQVTGAAWRAAIKIMTGVGDLVQRTGDSQTKVGYSMTR
jgi:hypothetical protein